MKGKIIKKNNVFYVRTISAGKELDEIELKYYPIFLTESNIELVEGKEIEFEIKTISHIDIEGDGENLINLAVIKNK